MYSIFKLSPDAAVHETAYGDLGQEWVSKLIQLFAETNVTVLDLAATIDWLWREEKRVDWRSEITKRKGVKARSGRLDRAIDLLREIGLVPPMPATWPNSRRYSFKKADWLYRRTRSSASLIGYGGSARTIPACCASAQAPAPPCLPPRNCPLTTLRE
jgi:hypothetical protein